MFKPKFNTEQELIDYLINLDNESKQNSTIGHVATIQCREGVFISSKLRRQILTGPNQGRCVINGSQRSFGFTDRKDGVYQVHIH